MPNLEGFKAYARLMPDDDDPSIKLCFDAAKEHAKSSGIPPERFDEASPKLDLYIYAMAAHWYDNRAFETIGKPNEFILRKMAAMRLELMYNGGESDG